MNENVAKLIKQINDNDDYSPDQYLLFLGTDIEIDDEFYQKNRILGGINRYYKIPLWRYRKYWYLADGADGAYYFIHEMPTDDACKWFLALFKITKTITFNATYDPGHYDLILHVCSKEVTNPERRELIETINIKKHTVNIVWRKSTLKQQISEFKPPRFHTTYNIEFVDDEK